MPVIVASGPSEKVPSPLLRRISLVSICGAVGESLRPEKASRSPSLSTSARQPLALPLDAGEAHCRQLVVRRRPPRRRSSLQTRDLVEHALGIREVVNLRDLEVPLQRLLKPALRVVGVDVRPGT